MNHKVFKQCHSATGEINKIITNKHGYELAHNPLLNKGSGFTDIERDNFELCGLLADKVETIEAQAKRAYNQLQTKDTDIGKYIYLNQLHDTNVTLFYKLAQMHIEEIMPLIYTPTVGDAVETFSKIMRRQQGVYISYNNRNKMDAIFSNYNSDEIDFIIVTDGEAVLGIGDQGVGGMDISIGKLMVYIICSGLNPARVLPIQLDVGTNNQKLLDDPEYLGWCHKRISGEDYDSFIAKFVSSVQKNFTNVYLHWEDFGRGNARRILDKYRPHMCTFNDDIQGTGIVAAANVLAGANAINIPVQKLRIVMFGAGTAGCGIADQIADLLQSNGISKEQAKTQIYLIDRYGLVSEYLSDIPSFQQPYIKSKQEVNKWNNIKDIHNISLEETICSIKPHILIGCSTVKGAFNEAIIRDMAKNNPHPIIMPLSNPTSHSEATPKDIIEWTDGKAIIAAGSPFDPVEYKGKTFRISQGNNAFIFPGLGLGVIAVKANRVTDNMIRAACMCLSTFSPTRNDSSAPLLPKITKIKDISNEVAIKVADQAIADGVATVKGTDDINYLVRRTQWKPEYVPYYYQDED